MVLDALIKIKNEIDPTLTFRRSCREGTKIVTSLQRQMKTGLLGKILCCKIFMFVVIVSSESLYVS